VHFRNGEREREHLLQTVHISSRSLKSGGARSQQQQAGARSQQQDLAQINRRQAQKNAVRRTKKKGDLGVRCKQKGVDAQLTWVFGGGLAEVESGGIGSRSGRKEKDNVRRGHRRFGRRQQSGDWCWTTYAAGDSGGVAAARLVRARGYSRTSTRRCRHQRHR